MTSHVSGVKAGAVARAPQNLRTHRGFRTARSVLECARDSAAFLPTSAGISSYTVIHNARNPGRARLLPSRGRIAFGPGSAGASPYRTHPVPRAVICVALYSYTVIHNARNPGRARL